MWIIFFIYSAQLFQDLQWNATYFPISNTLYQVQVSVTVPEPYHIYGTRKYSAEFGPTVTTFISSNAQQFELLAEPNYKESFDPNFELNVQMASGSVIYDFLIRSDSIPLLNVTYQLCTDDHCLPPQNSAIKMNASNEKLFKTTQFTENEHALNNQINNSSLLTFIFFSISMGFLALLTPCVFPMIPITISYFIKSNKESHWKSIKAASVYGLGIISTFTLMGVLLTQLFGVTAVQNFASSPITNLLIAILFILFSMSLFGLFDIQLPSFLLNFFNKKSQSTSHFANFFAGIAFSLVSFTCTVQFVGLLLVATGEGQFFRPLIGLFFFALAFASPFIILALFPNALHQLPKSGSWLHSAKIVMALLELAAAFKFISQMDLVWNLEILTRDFLLILWSVISFIIALYLLGIIQFSEDDKKSNVGFIRMLLAILFMALSLYFFKGLNGVPLQSDIDSYLPPADYGQTVQVLKKQNLSTHDDTIWIENLDSALLIAKEKNRLLFIDFTGKTCTNCRWMEKNMFTVPEIKNLMENYILVRLWTDFGEEKTANQNLEIRLFNTVALPYYAIMDANQKVINSFAGMTRSKEEFRQFLTSP